MYRYSGYFMIATCTTFAYNTRVTRVVTVFRNFKYWRADALKELVRGGHTLYVIQNNQSLPVSESR